MHANRGFRAAIFAVVWLLAAAYIATLIDRGWGPPDEGLLGQSAERFLRGELPHRDFDDLYSGALTVMHGAALSVFGKNLASMRLMLFGAVVLWIPFVYLVARRFVLPLPAAVVTLLAVAWSVPAYPASMPSWYNMFLATASLWAILKFIETSRTSWAFAAGVGGGLSIIIKITGLYVVAALFLAIAVHAYLTSPAGEERAPAAESGWRGVAAAMAGLALAALMTLALLALLAPSASLGTWLLLFASPAAVCAILGAIAWREKNRWTTRPVIIKPMLAVIVGVIVGAAPLVLWFASQAAIGDLGHGVFILPRARLDSAALAPNVATIVFAFALAYLVSVGARVRSRATDVTLVTIIVAGGAWVLLFGQRDPGPGGIGGGGPTYDAMVSSLAAILPFIVGFFAWLVMSGRTGTVSRERLAATFAVVAVAAFHALVAFPYANDLYFHYSVPLIALAGVAVGTTGAPKVPAVLASALAALYLAFALMHVAVDTTARLAVDRGGLRVSPVDSSEVEIFVDLMRTYGHNGYTFATPDAPEAYFLSGLWNPTRTMYEFFDREPDRTRRILETLDEHGVTVVAINHWRIFSPPEPELLQALEARYPHSARAWHFTVRWRDSATDE